MSPALLLVTLLAGQQMPAAETPVLSETLCGYVVTSNGPGAPLIEVPNLHVLEQTAGENRFSADIPTDAAIICERSSIVPAANDWKVPAAGYALYLVNGDEPNDRFGALEIAGSAYRYRLVRGTWTADEERRIAERVRSFQQHAR